jgi:hypothetical protein
MNEEILFTYTKLAKNHVQDILNVHPSQQPPQRVRGGAEFFRREFLTRPNDLYAATQRTGGILQQLALPGSANQPALAGAKIILGESDQGRDHFRKPVAPAG